MREVVMHNAEPYSTREATEILIKILDSTYANAALKQVSNNSTQMNAKEKTEPLRLLKYTEEFFYGT